MKLSWFSDESEESSRVPIRVLLLPGGKRTAEIASRIDAVRSLFTKRTLAFDVDSAEHLAHIAALSAKQGGKATAPDAYIAAIATAHGFSIATRNVKHFEHAGTALINPWE